MSAARTERLLNLLTLLLNARRPVSLREIRELEEFSAYCSEDPKSGERAFERDKAALIELGIPLRWVAPELEDEDEGGGGYVIDRERYYLPELHLSPADLALLSIAGAAAATLEGFPGKAAVIRALAKLGFDVDEAQARAPMLAHAPLLPGQDAEKLGAHLELLHDAVARRVRVRVSYQAARQDKTRREVDPYGLYYRQGAWYLVGYCHLRRAERTFHLGRIREVALVGKGSDYAVPADFDLSARVQQRPWEFPSEPPFEVRIRLAERLVPALREIFGSHAVLKRETEGALVTLNVSHRTALIAAVLPYGAAAEVLSPPELRQEIGRVYQDLETRYGKTKVEKAS